MYNSWPAEFPILLGLAEMSNPSNVSHGDFTLKPAR
jgi:hypothetical protein